MSERRPLQFSLLTLTSAVTGVGIACGMIRAMGPAPALASALFAMLLVFPIVGTVIIAKNYQHVGAVGESWLTRFGMLFLLGACLFGGFILTTIILVVVDGIW